MGLSVLPEPTDRRGGANFNTTPIDLFNPVETHANVDIGSFPVTRYDYQTSHSSGLFLQDTLTLAPTLKVVVGGRFDIFDRTTHRNPVENGVESEGPLDEGEFQDFSHRVGLVYQAAPAYDLYLQNSTSFQPQYEVNVDGTPLDPEYGVQYEAGQRARFLGERLQLSNAVFQIQKRNLTRSLGAGIYEQIGSLRARGFETELRGNVTPDWLLDVGYGFTAASFLDYTTSRGAVLSGNTPRRSPRHTVTFSTSYLWPNGLAVMGAGQYISAQFLNDSETVEFNGYERLSLGVSYTRGLAQYALNLTNVTNTAYWQSSLGAGSSIRASRSTSWPPYGSARIEHDAVAQALARLAPVDRLRPPVARDSRRRALRRLVRVGRRDDVRPHAGWRTRSASHARPPLTSPA